MESDRKVPNINLLASVIIIQCTFLLTVILNIKAARQVIGFLYLTLVPGSLVLKAIKLDNLDTTEKVVYSAGFSVAFLMIAGLLMNELLPSVSILRDPLSQVPLMIVLNGAVLSLALLSYVRSKDFSFPLNVSLRSFMQNSILLVPPALSVVGVMLVRVSPSNNYVLLLMILAISVLTVIISVLENGSLAAAYPWALFSFSIALLFHSSLASNYVGSGGDLLAEYGVYRLVETNLRWESVLPYMGSLNQQKYNAMLSITILPLVYSSMLDIEGIWVLKVVYPLILSFVPVTLYKLYRRIGLGEKVAFLAVFFLIATQVFYTEIVMLARQMIAELFYVLLFSVLLSDDLGSLNRTTCYVVFGIGLVVSHYSLSYLFLFVILYTSLSGKFLRYRNRTITVSLVAVFFTLAFSWYIYTSSGAPFDAGVSTLEHVYESLGDLWNLKSRSATVLRGLGLERPPTIWYTLSRALAYITEFLIVSGFIVTLRIQGKESVFKEEKMAILSINMVLLVMAIVLPQFAQSLRMTRFYHIVLLFLSPLCVIGGKFLLSYVSELRKETYVLTLLLFILVPYFLFQTNFVYEVMKEESWSVPLSRYRMSPEVYGALELYEERDVFGARWASRMVLGTIFVLDFPSPSILSAYGMMFPHNIYKVSSLKAVQEGNIFLRQRNFVNGTIKQDTNQDSLLLNDLNKVYSNAESTIFQTLPSP